MVSLFIYGYQFPLNNNLVELPGIYSRLEPAIYTKDFYVQAQNEPGVRFFFDYAMATVAHIVNSVPLAYFLCYCAAFTSFILSAYKLTKLVSGSQLTAGFVAFLCLRGVHITISEVDIFRTEPIPAVFAMGLTVWGIYFALARSWIKSYLCFGFAVFLQFLVGLLPGLLVLPILIYETCQIRDFKRAIAFISIPLCIFASFVALIYIPLIISESITNIQLEPAEFIRLYAKIRHPHHILPSHWRIGEFLGFLIAGLVCLCNTRQISKYYRNALLTIVIGAFVSFLITYLFVEIHPTVLIVKLQLGRTSPFLALALLLGIGSLATELLQKRHYALAALLIISSCITWGYISLPLASLLVVLWRKDMIPSRMIDLASWLLLGAIVTAQVSNALSEDVPIVPILSMNGVLIAALLLPWFWETPLLSQACKNMRGIRGIRKSMIAIVMLFFCSSFLLLGLTQNLAPKGLQLAFNQQLPLEKVFSEPIDLLALRAQAAIPTQSLVLIPPSKHSFRVLSKQSVVFDFKSFPYKNWAIQEWGKRLKFLVGDIQKKPDYDHLDQHYCSLNQAELITIARSFEATHILTSSTCHPDLALTPVDQEGEWLLYQL